MTAPILADGSRPATSAELFERLRALGIECSTAHHPPVFTVDEAMALRGAIPGCHTKNLFLRDKKGRMSLVVCLEDRDLDLKALTRALGGGSLSFGSADRLMRYLGVVPGAVSPLAVVNDHGGKVRVLLDHEILSLEPLNFHPLDNAMTTSMGTRGFLQFLAAEQHPPLIFDFERMVEVPLDPGAASDEPSAGPG